MSPMLLFITRLIDMDFFESIDSESKAYWFGFLMSDGYILKTSKKMHRFNRVSLNLTEGDKKHLELFQKHVNHTDSLVYDPHISKTSYQNRKPTYRLDLSSIKMCSDLMALGCTPYKTGFSNYPSIPQELNRHFIRGYFDGDGSISKCGSFGEFSITSDENILLGIQQILMKDCNLKLTKLNPYKKTNKAFSLRYGGKKQLLRIYDYLYQDATVFLQRKYNSFTLLFS
jgi:hypothetical protein